MRCCTSFVNLGNPEGEVLGAAEDWIPAADAGMTEKNDVSGAFRGFLDASPRSPALGGRGSPIGSSRPQRHPKASADATPRNPLAGQRDMRIPGAGNEFSQA